MTIVKRLKLPWLLALLCAASIGFVTIKEILDPVEIAELHVDRVRYGDLPVLTQVELWLPRCEVRSGESAEEFICRRSGQFDFNATS
jgi:hypothetical protein